MYILGYRKYSFTKVQSQHDQAQATGTQVRAKGIDQLWSQFSSSLLH